MPTSPQHAVTRTVLKKLLLQHCANAPRRLSMYRMFRSREFAELCRFYTEGIGIDSFAEFAHYVRQLEETFASFER